MAKVKRECCICGRVLSGTMVKGQGFMCQKHSRQWYKYGSIIDSSGYSIHCGNNEFVEYEKHYEIILRKSSERYKEVGRAIIDKEDYEKCLQHRWRMDVHKRDNGCVRYDVITGSPSKNNIIYLHRFLMNTDGEHCVDHIDGNPLNNLKSNLRVCTQKENVRNKTVLQSNNTSGITGVYKDSRNRETNWISEIRYNDVKIYLSAYIKLEDAVYCRYFAEKVLFKEFQPIAHYNILKPYIDKCENKESIQNKVRERIKAKIDINYFKAIS